VTNLVLDYLSSPSAYRILLSDTSAKKFIEWVNDVFLQFYEFLEKMKTEMMSRRRNDI
jgi:hypothetical protein